MRAVTVVRPTGVPRRVMKIGPDRMPSRPAKSRSSSFRQPHSCISYSGRPPACAGAYRDRIEQMHGKSGRAEQLDKQVGAFLFEDARGLEQTQIFLARQLGLLGLGQGCGMTCQPRRPQKASRLFAAETALLMVLGQ